MLYGIELWSLDQTRLQHLEKVQNDFVRIYLGLLGDVSGSFAGRLLGLRSVEAVIDKRKLVFLRQLLSASEHCIYQNIFVLRLIRWKWNPDKITGLIHDIIAAPEKYNMWSHLDSVQQSTDILYLSKSEKLLLSTKYQNFAEHMA